MADGTHRHSTAPSPDVEVAPSQNDAHAAGDALPVVTPPVTLPLRQALRQSVAAPPPKVIDITDRFTRACKALNVGQLVKDEYFTLFESIGAIEIMDAKMDSGFLESGETLEDTYDTSKALLPEELVGIMDQLLCHEMAWHTGYPLAQTLFTSVYIDKLLWPEPKTWEQSQFDRGSPPDGSPSGVLLQVLRAYCLALIKGCDFVIAKITSRDYFEEEDFCTQTYNRVLFSSTPIDVFLRELDAAVELVEESQPKVSDELRSAITARLEFRRDFLRALDQEYPLSHMSSSWSPVQKGIATIKSTHEFGKAVPEAFSSKMQRRLASTVPPRPIVELDFKDALEKLEHICADCEEATRFIDLQEDPIEYQSFLWSFAMRSPAPLAYARSYLASLLFHPEILNTSVSLPVTDIRSLVLPASPILDPTNWTLSPPRNALLPRHPRLQFANLMDEFVDRAGQPYLDLWVALGQNRCRLRRMLTHVITGWDLLQADASLVDGDLASAAAELKISDRVMDFSLSTWVYHRKLWMIEKVIILSFEQEVYLPDEFAAMYLFLHLIASRRYELLRRIIAYHASLPREPPASPPLSSYIPHLESLSATANGTANLALALARFYMISLYLQLIEIPHRPFSTPALRYELRMKPFLATQPPEVPDYTDFAPHLHPYGAFDAPTDTTLWYDLRRHDSDLWSEIDTALKTARNSFTEVKRLGAAAAKAEGVETAWVKEVQSVLASCVAAGVAFAGLKAATSEVMDGGTEMRTKVRVEVPEAGVGKRYSEGWIVPKVQKIDGA